VNLPPAPVNVRLVLAGDTEVPVECRYVGRAPDGVHVWQATAVTRVAAAVTAVHFDKLPPRTRVELLVAPDG
jgi:hypothetical protein